MKISGLSSVPGSVLATEYQREIIYSATVLLTWNCQVWHMLKENLFMCPRQTAVAAGLTWEEARQVLEQHLPTRWGTSVRATLHKVSHFSLNWKIKAQVAVLGGEICWEVLLLDRSLQYVWFSWLQKEMQISRKRRRKPVYKYSSNSCH